MTISALCGVTIFTVNASLLLGGGTRQGHLSDAILQLACVPLLLLASWRWWERVPVRGAGRILALWLAIIALPLLQTIPLPPSIWRELPHREQIAETLELIDRPDQWMPVSVAPFATWGALLSLIPPISLFFATAALGRRERRLVMLALLPVSVVSVLVGLVQVTQGPRSGMRFFHDTNLNEAVGFFANRNHFSALLYCAILIAAAWLSDSANQGVLDKSRNDKFTTATLVAILAAVTIIAMLLSGEAIARSRAGVLLTVAALGGALLVNRFDARKATSNVSTVKLLVGAILLSGAMTLQAAIYRFAARFSSDALNDHRWTIVRRSWADAMAYFPFGSGIATFAQSYAGFERPQDVLDNAYVNHAHNDYLEAVVEGGVFSVVLIAAFTAWWFLTTRRIWRSAGQWIDNPDASFTRAATIIVFLILAHSTVDYPLRTSAMMAVFAISCALMVEPSPIEWSGAASRASRDSRTSERRRPAAPPSTPPQECKPVEQMDWPDEWRRK